MSEIEELAALQTKQKRKHYVAMGNNTNSSQWGQESVPAPHYTQSGTNSLIGDLSH